jgi:hypothetical protein
MGLTAVGGQATAVMARPRLPGLLDALNRPGQSVGLIESHLSSVAQLPENHGFRRKGGGAATQGTRTVHRQGQSDTVLAKSYGPMHNPFRPARPGSTPLGPLGFEGPRSTYAAPTKSYEIQNKHTRLVHETLSRRLATAPPSSRYRTYRRAVPAV